MEVEARLTDPLDALLSPRPDGRLRVGLVVPQSGALGLTGPSAVDAALLAAHELNTAGGARGRYVDLVLVDGGRAPVEVAAQTARLGAAGAVDAVVGFHTSDVHRAVEAAVAGRTPYVFTPPHEGGGRRPGVVCTGVDPAGQLGAPVAWLARRHGVRRWALIGNDYIWPRAVHAQAHRLVAATGGTTVLDRRVPLGGVAAGMDRLVDDLRRARPDALLLSLVGRDLVRFNAALRHTGLDRGLVRLSGALEENGLLALDGDRTGLLYAAMTSFESPDDERRAGLGQRYRGLFGPLAPVVSSYAEGVYDGVRLVAALAAEGSLRPEVLVPAATRAIAAGGATGSGPNRVHLARADGLAFDVVA